MSQNPEGFRILALHLLRYVTPLPPPPPRPRVWGNLTFYNQTRQCFCMIDTHTTLGGAKLLKSLPFGSEQVLLPTNLVQTFEKPSSFRAF